MPSRPKEVEQNLRRVIRDAIVYDPLISVRGLQDILLKQGFKTTRENVLDWHYVANLVRKVRRESVEKSDKKRLQTRFGELSEKYRVISERLIRIAFYTKEMRQLGMKPPSYDEQMKALDMIFKLDLAILQAEMDAGIYQRKLGSMDITTPIPLDNAVKLNMLQVFHHWGLIKEPPKRIDINDSRDIKTISEPTKPKS
ncbi:MAG: hypothetical protein KJI72_00170 [Patescibacteria group bacterium]|nr:hypothetical protein [Patescibacteria group bacterium]